MIFGTSYMGTHLVQHLRRDMKDIKRSGFNEVLITYSENDFYHLIGKIMYAPKIAHDYGLKVIANFWGFACSFGGGRISRLLTDNPGTWVINREGKPQGNGCPNNPILQAKAKEFVDVSIKYEIDGFFWDEPTEYDCYCRYCKELYQNMFNENMPKSDTLDIKKFRRWGIVNYVKIMSSYVKQQNEKLFTSTCIMPRDKGSWNAVARLKMLDSFGTDPYWICSNEPVESVTGLTKDAIKICKKYKKLSHIWLQCWNIPHRRECEVYKAARLISRCRPDAIYVWAYKGQKGTTESCQNPELVWRNVIKAIREIKGRKYEQSK